MAAGRRAAPRQRAEFRAIPPRCQDRAGSLKAIFRLPSTRAGGGGMRAPVVHQALPSTDDSGIPFAPRRSEAPKNRIRKFVLPMTPPPPIAVVAFAAVFPGAPDVETFWRNVRGKADTCREVPPGRWAAPPGGHGQPEAPAGPGPYRPRLSGGPPAAGPRRPGPEYRPAGGP